MKEIQVDLAIIGAGPAGLAAALEAKRQGIRRVALLERDEDLGGILQQCIHDGFGLHRFGQMLSGGQYAQRFADELRGTDVEIMTGTMVLEIQKDKTIYACNQKDGMLRLNCRSILLAMGCRERTASQVLIHGSRPAGVMTAGAAQRYINMEGYLPGQRAVILGSGDIGLIMARRMTLEGMDVLGVYEVMEHPGGLTRNVVQCLDDYDIPLHLAKTVVAVHGKQRLHSVTVAQVNSERQPIPGTEEEVECDLLVLAVGLIPENELSRKLEMEMDPKTGGPVVDSHFMTSRPGVFAAGNVVAVFDLVDYVSDTGEAAARGAASYLKGQDMGRSESFPITRGENVQMVVPQRACQADSPEPQVFYLRVCEPKSGAVLQCSDGKQVVSRQKYPAVAPPEMLSCRVEPGRYNHLEIKVVES